MPPFLRKNVRMSCKCIPVRLITAFLKNKKPIERFILTSRHSFLNGIKKIIPNVDIYGSLYTLGHTTFNELRWTILMNNL